MQWGMVAGGSLHLQFVKQKATAIINVKMGPITKWSWRPLSSGNSTPLYTQHVYTSCNTEVHWPWGYDYNVHAESKLPWSTSNWSCNADGAAVTAVKDLKRRPTVGSSSLKGAVIILLYIFSAGCIFPPFIYLHFLLQGTDLSRCGSLFLILELSNHGHDCSAHEEMHDVQITTEMQ